MKEQTLALIKPDAIAKRYQGLIIHDILEAEFEIKAMKMLYFTKDQAQSFYIVHKEKDFYEPLIKFMTSGSIIALLLEKDNAIADYRKLIGNIDMKLAAEGTLRKKYAESTRHNAVHGSDNSENAKKEIAFFF
ncbi:MAG: nucleoside-diphosphate kinase [Candidatus Marinimicrobia bacterium]|nr:nucleoside-diphosphate kinase [Candidatus Neomarinimicrobiota bacterium]